ncbi:MAG: hypothetical protein ACP5RR_05520 [Candidatus Kapaibacteriota bacterium]|jgi:hypothetical protein
MRKFNYLKALVFVIVGLLALSCEKDEQPIAYQTCDTSVVSYQKDILPIISSCIYCHNSTTKAGGVIFEDYLSIRNSTLNGELFRSINTTMKKYFYGTYCDILKIKAWMNQGFKN